jgi:hypothetical protein
MSNHIRYLLEEGLKRAALPTGTTNRLLEPIPVRLWQDNQGQPSGVGPGRAAGEGPHPNFSSFLGQSILQRYVTGGRKRQAMERFGYHGKILHINLKTRQSRIEESGERF